MFAECTGGQPLGMVSRRIIKQQISASSQWDHNHGPELGRLYQVIGRGRRGEWVAKTEDPDQYFRVMFFRNVTVTNG